MNCAQCSGHGFQSPIKYHKRVCPFIDCHCVPCERVRRHRESNRRRRVRSPLTVDTRDSSPKASTLSTDSRSSTPLKSRRLDSFPPIGPAPQPLGDGAADRLKFPAEPLLWNLPNFAASPMGSASGSAVSTPDSSALHSANSPAASIPTPRSPQTPATVDDSTRAFFIVYANFLSACANILSFKSDQVDR